MSTYESTDKLVKKEIINAGKFSKKPTELATCYLHVAEVQCLDMTLQQIKDQLHSEIVDENADKVVTIGDACSTVDRLLERAIQTMSLEEESLVTVQVTRDEQKSETVVLSAKVRLERVEFSKPIWEWSPQDKHDIALKYKEKGVELFKVKRYVDAFHIFGKACKILITLEPIEDPGSEAVFKRVIELRYVLYNNMAECQLIRENHEHVITLCNKVLAKDGNNVKALYRRGVAHAGLRNFEQASSDLKSVITLEPKNQLALEKYNVYNEKWRESVHGYENIVRKMFKAT